MAIIEYSLFRVKFVLPRQQSWLHYHVTPRDIFLASLKARPDSQVREGYTWHIGNVRFISPTAGYFAIGRTTRSTIEKYDATTGNFAEEELETSPYTHCVFDAEIGFVGIAKKTSLSPTTAGIARRVEDLLSRTAEVMDNDIRVEIAPIPDPESFLQEIRDAFAVLQFTATFHGPNPFDADEHFQKPLSSLLSAADGKKGKTQIDGDDLNREVLEAVTKSTAATGNEASARIKRKRNGRATKIRLKGSTVGTSYEEESHNPEQALADLRGMYQRVSQ
jgi:hypothetical protein